MTKNMGVAVVPTQTLMTRWLVPSSPAEMASEPEMKYISAAQRYSWRQNKERLLNSLAFSDTGYFQFIFARENLLKDLQEAGVMILLGSDAPQVFNVPGFSIHHEMQDMAEAGLSPYEILQSGTTNVAKFFKMSGRLGSISIGKMADLVLLEENPLENIKNAQSIVGVMYRGNWLPKKEIDSRLKKIEEKYAEK